MTNDPTLSELEQLERRGWDSLCDGTGAEFYKDVMSEDGLMVLADGSVLHRDDVVMALRNAPPWDHYEMADVRVLSMGQACGALVYTGTAHRQSGPPIVAVMSSVYRRRGARWRLALYQQTPIPST